jgi:beta-glucosidase
VDVARVNETLRSKPTILAVNFSSPWVLEELQGTSGSTLLATFGTTPEALLDIVSGAYKPTGKLPFTIPVSEKAVADNLSDVPGHLEAKGYALFSFGHGLSY